MKLRNYFRGSGSMKLAQWSILALLFMDSCIEPFNLKVNNQEVLVVDGMITDQPGPYVVKIYTTLPLNDQLDKTNWIIGASVSISDDLGNVENLMEVIPGNYKTKTLQGVPGRTYQLKFSTMDGDQYESTPEKLVAVGEIANLRLQFEEHGSPLAIDQSNPSYGFNILLDANVLPEQEGMVRWRWTGTFGIQAYPELRTKAVTNRAGETVIVPDPPKCSGWQYYFNSTQIHQIDVCTCCYCWVTQYTSDVLLSDQHFISNDSILGQKIAYIQANRRYLYDKYYLVVEQMSISKAVYDFWTRVQQQTTGSNLFQTPPPPTTGNVSLVSGTKPSVGIFGASSIKKQNIIITRDDVPSPYVVPQIDTIAASCLEAYRYTSTIKPPFW